MHALLRKSSRVYEASPVVAREAPAVARVVGILPQYLERPRMALLGPGTVLLQGEGVAFELTLDGRPAE